MKKLTIGLIGNPNSGKTTLFNQLTGSRQRVGNWAGVTVEKKEGNFLTEKHQVKLVDLPGIYSLTTISEQTSLDEQIACRYILSGEADLIINVVDSSNLERNLYLTLQLLEPGIPCIIVLNMLDIAYNQHIKIDITSLAQLLGCSVIPLISSRAYGIIELKNAIDVSQKNSIETLVEYPVLMVHIERLSQAMPKSLSIKQRRWIAIQMLEGSTCSSICTINALKILPKIQEILKQTINEDPALIIADLRYQRITDICDFVCNTSTLQNNFMTEKLDKIVLNRWMGIPIFLLIMYIMFFLAINIGGALQPLFDIGSSTIFVQGLQWIGYKLNFPDWLTILLAEGGGGINSILPMIPQIGIMYLLLSFLEDSGYMARAAFIVDRMMQVIGLPGKSFIPLIVGFGCNVSAVMGARTLDSPRERLITVLMAPFMSCGARLAIFAIFSTAFFGQGDALIVFSLYIIGIVMAILTGLMLKHTIIRGEPYPFVMELPAYHVPNLKILLMQTWPRLKDFILRAGKIIISASIVIGILNSFSFSGKPVDCMNDSVLASVSKIMTPLLKPIGIRRDNWQAMVGLITGAMAKEVVVSTLNTLYAAEKIYSVKFDPEEYNLLKSLGESLENTWDMIQDKLSIQLLSYSIKTSKNEHYIPSGSMGVMGNKFGSASSTYAYLIFILLYLPCISVMGTIACEINHNWMVFSILWSLNIAYSLATVFYQLANFASHPKYSAITISLVIIFNTLLLIGLRYSGNLFSARSTNDDTIK
ncbi:Fe(2+) transporter permease subunit FeoB [Candidatus Profftia tarda]|nr:Fe(2+) transporter permease subunit FeoB [Candidatus Profftia tarda]